MGFIIHHTYRYLSGTGMFREVSLHVQGPDKQEGWPSPTLYPLALKQLHFPFCTSPGNVPIPRSVQVPSCKYPELKN
ncbi:hypothetical protein BofuT4_P071820.1 [Botrytis cinerea T4]|uniref:Uncharacterized protein n=1 Tax=Botryotinia fuckeliana (strain T4) TaxID=999810 RepID=G2XPZ8_BOTF4|nr:hypothetical protein BofuT4_P071820.1 [Botrytis cinerea T4]